MKRILSLLFVIVFIGSGCAYHHFIMMDHPKPIVYKPAELGAYGGAIIGIPVAVLCLPVTLLLPADGGERRFGYMIAPLIPFGYLGNELLGRPLWLLFGWWGEGGVVFVPDEEETPARANNSPATSSPDKQ